MENTNLSENELLQFLLKQYNLTEEDVLKQKNDMIKSEILKQHKENFSPVWQGANGRWYTYLPKEGGGRRQIAKCTEDKVNVAICDYYQQNKLTLPIQQLTLRELYPIWFQEKWLENGNSNTMKHIDLEWRTHYLNDDIIDRPVATLSKQELKNWVRQKIVSNNLTKKQYYNMQLIMRQALDYLVENDYITENPFRAFTISKRLFSNEAVKEPEKEVFSIEEEKAIKETAMEDFLHYAKRSSCLAVIVNFSLGLRVGELVALKWKDYQQPYIKICRMEQKQYTLSSEKNWEQHIEVVEHTKSDCGCRTLYTVEKTQEILMMIYKYNTQHGYDCSPDSYIFQHKGKRITANSIDWYYEKYCNKLHIRKKGNHKARKTCLTKIADNPNINLKDAMEFAGHVDVKTFVKHYCFSRYSDDYKRKELEKSLG